MMYPVDPNVLISMISLELGKIFGIFLNVVTEILMYIGEVTAKMPFSSITVITPNLITVVLYYLFLFFVYKKKHIKKILIIILIFLSIVSIIKIFPKKLSINFIDVGQRR